MIGRSARLLLLSLVLVVAVTAPAAAQQWCYDACGPYTDCSTACNNGYMTTCGEWGSCDYRYCTWASVCNSGVECITECYDGEWPNGQWTTCGTAGKPCTVCEPNYQYVTDNVVGQYSESWQDWVYQGEWYLQDFCRGYQTTQEVWADQAHCIGSTIQSRDCHSSAITNVQWSNSCCAYMSGGCWGEAWPSSCTN